MFTAAVPAVISQPELAFNTHARIIEIQKFCGDCEAKLKAGLRQ